jgi:hypothetical protein
MKGGTILNVKVTSIGLKGMEGYRVNVEVKAIGGVESIVIVGLPDASVKESKDRIMAALHSLGYSIADRKIIISLSPSEQKNNGPMFDLAMAISVLLSLKELKVIIADELSHLCGVLSQSLRRKEPPSAEWRAIINRIKKSLLYNYVACKLA